MAAPLSVMPAPCQLNDPVSTSTVNNTGSLGVTAQSPECKSKLNSPVQTFDKPCGVFHKLIQLRTGIYGLAANSLNQLLTKLDMVKQILQ
jgi:hypothetical protein